MKERVNIMFIRKIGKVYELKGFVLGTFVGATVAGLTALLLAPKSGQEVREDIKDRTLKTKDQASDYMHKAKDKGHELKDSVNEKKSNYMKDASASYEQLSNQVGDKLVESKDNLEKIKKEARETADNVKDKMKKDDNNGSKNDPTVPSATSSTLEHDYDSDKSKTSNKDKNDDKTHHFNPDNK